MSAPYNILSLDGGGSWALIQVRCLQKLFGDEAKGHAILRHFHLVAANSGGSIVLAALVADLPLSGILQLFRSEEIRRDLFSPTGKWWWRLLQSLAGRTGLKLLNVGPRYSTSHKLAALNRQLPQISELCLEQVPAHVAGPAGHAPHVLITTFDYNRQRASFFRSNAASFGDGAVLQAILDPAAPPTPQHKNIRLLQAVHASSTAPVNFFDVPAEIIMQGQPNYFWDGGVAGYNNPVLAAVTEALVNNVAADAIRVLSIGAGTQVYPILLAGQRAEFDSLATAPTAADNFLADIRKLASAVVGAPPDAASFVAFTALNPGFVGASQSNQNFIRANPSVQPHLEGTTWRAPANFSREAIAAVRKLELDAITPEAVQLVTDICEAWLTDALPNQPIRVGPALNCLVGQSRFSEVAEQFRRLFPGVGAVALSPPS